LAVAKSIASSGRAVLTVSLQPEEDPSAYVMRIWKLKASLGSAQVQPADEAAHHLGHALWKSGIDNLKWINQIQHGKYELPSHWF
jgi:hypothetical protein